MGVAQNLTRVLGVIAQHEGPHERDVMRGLTSVSEARVNNEFDEKPPRGMANFTRWCTGRRCACCTRCPARVLVPFACTSCCRPHTKGAYDPVEAACDDGSPKHANRHAADVGQPPPVLWVHMALFFGQLGFGASSIIGKFGIHGGNPVLFALVREAVTSLVLCSMNAFFSDMPLLPRAPDVTLVVFTGFCIYTNHLCFIIGLKLTDPVSGSAWQPSQPIFTAAFAILVGFERSSARKALGILTAVSGAVFMVLDGGQSESKEDEQVVMVGHTLFFSQCVANSIYCIASKKLLRKYRPASVAGWAFGVASMLMFFTTCFVNRTANLLAFVCADDEEETKLGCIRSAWVMRRNMLLPVLFYIMFGSLAAYFLVAWANQYAKASVVSAYTVVQTLTASGVSAILVAVGGLRWAESYGLRAPGQQDLGVVPIILGLSILFGEPTMEQPARSEKHVANVEDIQLTELSEKIRRSASTPAVVGTGAVRGRAVGESLPDSESLVVEALSEGVGKAK